MSGHPPLIGFLHSCTRVPRLRHASDVRQRVECYGCGGSVVVEAPIRFGPDEWETTRQHVQLRDALELLGVPLSNRKRRLAMVAIARLAAEFRYYDCLSDPLVLEVMEGAERAADEGFVSRPAAWLDGKLRTRRHEANRTGPKGEPLLLLHDWVELAQACLEPEPLMHRLRQPQAAFPGRLYDLTSDLLTPVVRDLVPNPFVPLEWNPEWLTPTVQQLATHIYENRDFFTLPILGDALMDAGCDHQLVQEHCQSTQPHARGCWVVDAILGKS